MTQVATVERLLPGGMAEISVPRKSACGHDCESCAGCGMTGSSVHAMAHNAPGAQPGQKVVVESSNRTLYRAVLLVYLVPVVLFFAGYFAAAGLASEAARCAVAVAAFFLGILPAVWYDRRARRRGDMVYTITRIL